MNDDFNSRDLFAGLAMVGMLSNGDWFGNAGRWNTKEAMTETYAIEAYELADAMLEARRKQND